MSDLPKEGQYFEAVSCAQEGKDGLHRVRWGKTKKGGLQSLVYFELTGDTPHKGERYPWFGHWTENSYERTVESFRVMGAKGSDIKAWGLQKLDGTVSVKIEHQEITNAQSGKSYKVARVAWVNKPGSGAIQLESPVVASELERISGVWQARVKAIPETDGSGGAPGRDPEQDDPFGYGDGQQPPPATDHYAGDDIPF